MNVKIMLNINVNLTLPKDIDQPFRKVVNMTEVNAIDDNNNAVSDLYKHGLKISTIFH